MKHEEQQNSKRGREREREKKHDRNGFETPYGGGFNGTMEESGFQMSDFPDGDWLYKVSVILTQDLQEVIRLSNTRT